MLAFPSKEIEFPTLLCLTFYMITLVDSWSQQFGKYLDDVPKPDDVVRVQAVLRDFQVLDDQCRLKQSRSGNRL